MKALQPLYPASQEIKEKGVSFLERKPPKLALARPGKWVVRVG